MTLQVTEIFAVVLVLYFLFAQVLAIGFRVLEKKLSRGLGRGGLGQ
jgi:polar amino acid transport system permease protein